MVDDQRNHFWAHAPWRLPASGFRLESELPPLEDGDHIFRGCLQANGLADVVGEIIELDTLPAAFRRGQQLFELLSRVGSQFQHIFDPHRCGGRVDVKADPKSLESFSRNFFDGPHVGVDGQLAAPRRKRLGVCGLTLGRSQVQAQGIDATRPRGAGHAFQMRHGSRLAPQVSKAVDRVESWRRMSWGLSKSDMSPT